MPQVRLNQRRESVDPLAHIDRPAREVNPGTRSWPDHASSATRIRARKVAASSERSNFRTRPPLQRISTVPPRMALPVFSYSADRSDRGGLLLSGQSSPAGTTGYPGPPLPQGEMLGAKRKSVGAEYRVVAQRRKHPERSSQPRAGSPVSLIRPSTAALDPRQYLQPPHQNPRDVAKYGISDVTSAVRGKSKRRAHRTLTAKRRVRSRMWAIVIQASADATDFSQSFASLRHLPSHAKVRSTTQRRGRTSKPFALSLRLTIWRVNLPT